MGIISAPQLASLNKHELEALEAKSYTDEEILRRHKAPALPSIPDGFANMLICEHGATMQSIVLIEECTELQKELCKNQRRLGANKPTNKAAIIEEMTHVLISMQVTMAAMDITEEEIRAAFAAKIAEYSGDDHNGNI